MMDKRRLKSNLWSLLGLFTATVVVTALVLFSWFSITVSVEMFGLLGFVGWCVVAFALLNAVVWRVEP